jgi:hypothetical protein
VNESSVGPRVIANVAVSDNLGQVESAFGSVWASDVHGTILRIDPRTRSVKQRIAVGGNDNAPGGTPVLGTGSGAVWAVPQPPSADQFARLLRIDPRTGDVTSRHVLRMPDGRPLGVADLEFLGGVPWVVGSQGALEIDPATGAPKRFIKTELPAGQPFPLWLSGDDHDLWEITRDERILRYGLVSGRLERTLPVRLPDTVALVSTPQGLLLVTRDGRLALADPSDGRIEWNRRLGNVISLPLPRGDVLYVHATDTNGGRDRLIVVDLASGEVRSSTGLPEFGIAGMVTCSPAVLSGQAAGIRWVCPPSFQVAATSSGVR